MNTSLNLYDLNITHTLHRDRADVCNDAHKRDKAYMMQSLAESSQLTCGWGHVLPQVGTGLLVIKYRSTSVLFPSSLSHRLTVWDLRAYLVSSKSDYS